jgi:ABC-type uncharacterized transport system involved in gliding motility auxiliary subunit
MKKETSKVGGLLWALTGILLLALLFARVIYPEYLWLTVGICVPLIASMGALIHFNRQALRTRSAAYGVNSAVTILLVVAIVGLLNFLGMRYPKKLDLTKNKIHSLSEQTIKIVKGLDKPVKATLFAKTQQRETLRPLLDNYKGLNPKFDVEYVDPDREPTRTKQAGVKKYGTLHLELGTRESNVDDVTEEKLTNALIKLLKDKVPNLCAITGHGEHSFQGADAEGYSAMKKALSDQSYNLTDLNLVQEAKVPDTCDGIAIIGPSKAFFAPELKILSDYLDNGGRAIVALDINIKGAEPDPELIHLLSKWSVQVDTALVVDPASRAFGVDASVPVIAIYSKENPIVKDFRIQDMSYFPFLRPLEVIPGAPASLKVQWLAQTTSKSFGVTDMKELASGAVTFHQGRDKMGPLDAAIAVEGKQKDSKAPRNTRLVVFGTSNFANNNFSRYGANSDFFLNATAWVMEDESTISIRAKDEGASRVELSQKQGMFIFLLTVIVIPVSIAVAGIVVWVLRRRL